MSAEPTLSSLLDRVIHTALRRMFVSRPGRVDAYDAATQTITVTPVLREVLEGREQTRVQELPQISNVPLCWPRAGDWFMSAPLSVGDYVLLICADRSLDVWQQRGGAVDPVDLRRHSITDAIAIPGVYPSPDVLTESDLATDMVIGKQAGAVVRILPDGSIELGSSASTKQAVALADDVKTELDKLKDDVNNLKTAIAAWVPVPADGGAALQVALTAWASAAISIVGVGSSKIKVQE